MNAVNYLELSKDQLLSCQAELQKKYEDYVNQKLKLDMSRGKPAGTQLDLVNGILDTLDSYITADGTDARNYGLLDGIPEAKKLFSDLLGISVEKIIIGGNSSLNMMYDTIVRHYIFGTQGHTPWKNLPNVKFLCPAPGYDRHFAICEDLGIEMITVPMLDDGPDMDLIEKLVANDDSIKGIWCVPLYSNPQGICYSNRVVERLASMKTAAPDFRIFWDNAYGVHHIYAEEKLADIFACAEKAGNPDRPIYFFSTSKITYPGAGIALEASSLSNIREYKKHMGIQTIGPDKLNQLRTVRYLKDAEGVRSHMRKLAGELKPKFDIVLNTLDRELCGSGLATWTTPKGGYFIAVDTLDNCARETIALAKNAGVTLTSAGAAFPYKKDPRDRNIRIAPTYPTVDELRKAIELFCVCVKLAGVQKLFYPEVKRNRLLQRSFCGRNPLDTRIKRHRHTESAGKAFEHRFKHVMGLTGIQSPDMQIHPAGIGKRAEEFTEQRNIKFADVLCGSRNIIHQIRPAGKIKRNQRQHFVHRQDHMSVTCDPRLVAESIGDRLAESEPGILHRVMAVNFQIAFHTNFKIEFSVLCKQGQHVIHERDPRGNRGGSLSVQINGNCNIGFFGFTDHFCFSHVKSPVLWKNVPLKSQKSIVNL